jgi:hypothetical protein
MTTSIIEAPPVPLEMAARIREKKSHAEAQGLERMLDKSK